jgi:hypothetical protein
MVKLNCFNDVVDNIGTTMVPVSLALLAVFLQCGQNDFGVKDSGTLNQKLSFHNAQ